MVLSTLFTLETAAQQAVARMVVLSDIHLLSPELIVPGSAINRADANDSKMMAMSDNIMAALTDSILDLKPDIVLLTGDLTYTGERQSHERIAQYLGRMAEQGIQPLVIPGNHDCNNPYARRYDGDKVQPTATVTRDEFAQIYRDYGYGDSFLRDPASLSYCCGPVPGVVIIGIDSNMDERNGQAQQATDEGKRVIAMMHHHLVPHFDQEDRLLANYIVHNHDTIARQLLEAGVHVVFTGHLHVTDVATLYNRDHSDSIVEVATGSAICYPFALRVATLEGETSTADVHSVNIDTRWLTSTSNCPTLREKGRQRIINATPGLASMLSDKAWNKLGGRMGQLKAMLEMGGGKANLPETSQQASQLVLRHLREVLSRTMLAVVEGNEQDKDVESIIDEGKEGIRAIIEEVAPEQAEGLWEFFLGDVYPMLDPIVRGILEDRNGMGTPDESHTDDLNLSIRL